MCRRLRVAGLVASIVLVCLCSCVRPEGRRAPRATRVAVPGRPRRLVAYKGKAVVSVFGKEGGVAIVDPAMRQTDAYLPGHPEHRVASLAVAGDKLFAAQALADAIVVYDLRTLERIHTVPVGGEGGMAAAPDGRHVYFGHNTRREFYIIDTSSYESRRVAYPETPLGQGSGCSAAAVAPDGTMLYLGIQMPTPFLAVYNLEKGRYETPIHLYKTEWRDDEGTRSGTVGDLAFSLDGTRLFAGMSQSARGIFVIDRRTHEVRSNIAFEPGHARHRWADPIGLAAYGDKLVVVSRNRDELAVLNAEGKVVAAEHLGKSPEGPVKVLVLGGVAVVSHPGERALLFVDLRELLRREGQ